MTCCVWYLSVSLFVFVIRVSQCNLTYFRGDNLMLVTLGRSGSYDVGLSVSSCRFLNQDRGRLLRRLLQRQRMSSRRPAHPTCRLLLRRPLQLHRRFPAPALRLASAFPSLTSTSRATSSIVYIELHLQCKHWWIGSFHLVVYLKARRVRFPVVH